jgi:hypothetical protein
MKKKHDSLPVCGCLGWDNSKHEDEEFYRLMHNLYLDAGLVYVAFIKH